MVSIQMSGAGIVGKWIINPQFQQITRIVLFESVAGINPLDGGVVTSLDNIRGKVTVIGKVSGEQTHFSFVVSGGQNYASEAKSSIPFRYAGFPEFCDVVSGFDIADNAAVFTVRPEVTSGGREYEFRFYPFASLGASIRLSGGAPLGANDLTITLKKVNVVGDYR